MDLVFSIRQFLNQLRFFFYLSTTLLLLLSQQTIYLKLNMKINDIYFSADEFYCRIVPDVVKNLTNFGQDECHPLVLCEIHNPYNNWDSLLKRSQCGYDNISFWLYLFIRSIADIFTAAAVVLLGTAVVIATRETSTGMFLPDDPLIIQFNQCFNCRTW